MRLYRPLTRQGGGGRGKFEKGPWSVLKNGFAAYLRLRDGGHIKATTTHALVAMRDKGQMGGDLICPDN